MRQCNFARLGLSGRHNRNGYNAAGVRRGDLVGTARVAITQRPHTYPFRRPLDTACWSDEWTFSDYENELQWAQNAWNESHFWLRGELPPQRWPGRYRSGGKQSSCSRPPRASHHPGSALFHAPEHHVASERGVVQPKNRIVVKNYPSNGNCVIEAKDQAFDGCGGSTLSADSAASGKEDQDDVDPPPLHAEDYASEDDGSLPDETNRSSDSDFDS